MDGEKCAKARKSRVLLALGTEKLFVFFLKNALAIQNDIHCNK